MITRKINPSKLTTEITCTKELEDEDIKTAIMTIFFMFKKLRHRRYKNGQIRLLEVKITMSMHPLT